MFEDSIQQEMQPQPENSQFGESSANKQLQQNSTMAHQIGEVPNHALGTESAPRPLLIHFQHAEKCKHILHPGGRTLVLHYCPPCVIKEDLENFRCIKEVLDEHVANHTNKGDEFGRIRTKLNQRRIILANNVIKFEKWAKCETKWEKRNPDVDVSGCYSSSAALKLARNAADAAAAAELGTPETEPVKEGAEKKKSNKKQKLMFHPFQQHRPESQYRPQAYWARRSPRYEPGLYADPTGDGWQNTSFMNDLNFNYEHRLSRREKNAAQRKNIGEFLRFGLSCLDATNQTDQNEDEHVIVSEVDEEGERDSESDTGSDSEDFEYITRQRTARDGILDGIVFEASDEDSYDVMERRPLHSRTLFQKWDKISVKDTKEKEDHQEVSNPSSARASISHVLGSSSNSVPDSSPRERSPEPEWTFFSFPPIE